MLWISAIVVFGTLGWVFTSLGPSGAVAFGIDQLIHARVPWALLGVLWAGTGLGLFAMLRRRRWFAFPIVGAELVLVGAVSWYVLQYSDLPPHELAVAVGEPFPAYTLVDQDGAPHTMEAGTPREPALYIFYRGDW